MESSGLEDSDFIFIMDNETCEIKVIVLLQQQQKLWKWADLEVGRGGRGHLFSFEILYYFYRITSRKNKKYLE